LFLFSVTEHCPLLNKSWQEKIFVFFKNKKNAEPKKFRAYIVPISESRQRQLSESNLP